ncbi:hypothetical protein LRH25_32210 [Ideonella azotifigens]|uniref:Exo-alpha-sialidase n=1 Tax=Ideonella azotifigens TaxID=513160 RepID=A0ABN1KLH5_9BURK|nr:hypothetical protein [Ideonella azotifigens]MCD2344987.1 hypothetical protein [Ideonella azotifigens]
MSKAERRHPASPFAGHRALLISLMLGGLLAPAAGWAQLKPGFAPNEAQASARTDLIDLEFSASRNMFTWCDYKGHLWVGTIDPVTGNFLKPTYRMLDSDAITPQEMNITTNGPEWISTATGDHVVYTKFAGGVSKASTARLAMVEGSADGSTWGTPTLLGPDAGRNAPYASDDDGDPNPRISYVDAKNNHYWRYVYQAASEAKVQGMARTPKPVSVRFTKGYAGLVYAQAVNGINQVFLEHLDSGRLVQITNDDGAKDERTVPWVWRAPEYGNKLTLMSTVNGNELRFFQQADGDGLGDSPWSPIGSVMLPEGGTVASPEPFTYNGNSYVVLAIKSVPNDYPSAIYVAAIAPTASPRLWKVSDDSALRIRMDPEVFITGGGPVVFYNRFNPAVNPDSPYCADCSEGVWRASTGL